MDIQTLLFSFEGRVNRKRYWLAAISLTVAVAILYYVLSQIDAALGTMVTLMDLTVPTNNGGATTVPFQLGVLTIILYVVQLWPGLALAIKRCHDRGRSGWFLLLQLVPILNFWPVIEILFLRGTVGPNRFGPDPLAPGAQQIEQVFT